MGEIRMTLTDTIVGDDTGDERRRLSESEGKRKANSNPILALGVYYSRLFVLVAIYSEKKGKLIEWERQGVANPIATRAERMANSR